MLVSSLVLAASIGGAAAHRSRGLERNRHVARFAIEESAPAGKFKVVGDSGVSAQMMFVGTKNIVYILDKAENNTMHITTNGVDHPAWGTKFDMRDFKTTPLEVSSNTFCAAGVPVANGSWVVFGGNQAVTHGGKAVKEPKENPSGENPYMNEDGGKAVRLITPCDDDSCQWNEGGDQFTMQARRWYPTTETLADGSVIILGGSQWGGFVSNKGQNVATYEYWPKRPEGQINMKFLDDTLPLSLYPLTWLLPSGRLFLQANYKAILYEMDTKKEIPLADIPYAARVYPASGSAAMLPLTPENNYTAEILFCGGSAADLSKSDGGAGFNVTAVKADDSCVRIRPDDPEPKWVDDDRLPESRSMGSLVYLPDGTMWLGNGVEYGVAGYGDDNKDDPKGWWSKGPSYGQVPLYTPTIYDPKKEAGKRWSREGLEPSEEERMYHSTAVLLADGAVLVSGSNPNADVTTEAWATKYSIEKWYPTWYNEPRPPKDGLAGRKLSYGGDPWNITLKDPKIDPTKIKVSVVRTGFSTHGMNFGQRYLELQTSYKHVKETGEITLHVSQMPPNANIFPPGPAMIFLVVDGIPSEGEMVTVGSGEMGEQPVGEASKLPDPQVVEAPATTSNSPTTDGSTSPTAQPTSTETADNTDTTTNGNTDTTTATNGNTNGNITDTNQNNKDSGAGSLLSPVLAVALTVLGAVAWF